MSCITSLTYKLEAPGREPISVDRKFFASPTGGHKDFTLLALKTLGRPVGRSTRPKVDQFEWTGQEARLRPTVSISYPLVLKPGLLTELFEAVGVVLPQTGELSITLAICSDIVHTVYIWQGKSVQMVSIKTNAIAARPSKNGNGVGRSGRKSRVSGGSIGSINSIDSTSTTATTASTATTATISSTSTAITVIDGDQDQDPDDDMSVDEVKQKSDQFVTVDDDQAEKTCVDITVKLVHHGTVSDFILFRPDEPFVTAEEPQPYYLLESTDDAKPTDEAEPDPIQPPTMPKAGSVKITASLNQSEIVAVVNLTY